MSITWDGDTIKLLMDNAPSVNKDIQQALDTGEYTYIDFTDIQSDTTTTKTGKNWGMLLLVGALFSVGLILIVRK